MVMNGQQGLTFPVTSIFPGGAEARGKFLNGPSTLSKKFLFPISNLHVRGARKSISTEFSSSRVASPTLVLRVISTTSDFYSKVAKKRSWARCSGTFVSTSKKNREISCCVGTGHCDADFTASSHDESQFLEAAQKGNLVPLFKMTTIFSDQLTPMMIYGCLVEEGEPNSHSFLFENTEEKKSSNQRRFSSLGTRPATEIIVRENKLVILNHELGSREEKAVIDPMNEPGRIASTWQPVMVDGLPDTFCGGWVGHFSYDKTKNVGNSKDVLDHIEDTNLPNIHLGLYKDVIVFDHDCKLVYAIHWVQLDHFDNLQEAYSDGELKLNILANEMLNAQRLCGLEPASSIMRSFRS